MSKIQSLRMHNENDDNNKIKTKKLFHDQRNFKSFKINL